MNLKSLIKPLPLAAACVVMAFIVGINACSETEQASKEEGQNFLISRATLPRFVNTDQLCAVVSPHEKVTIEVCSCMQTQDINESIRCIESITYRAAVARDFPAFIRAPRTEIR